jgi:two-component system nitrogen regulation response regulator NtrX
VERFCADNNLKTKRFDASAIDALRRHPWRGNVRELRNTVERALIMVPEQTISAGQLTDILRGPSAGGSGLEMAGTLKDFKEAAERSYLVHKLRESNWNISATATAIGTPRSNLYKKLEQYEISQEKDG